MILPVAIKIIVNSVRFYFQKTRIVPSTGRFFC